MRKNINNVLYIILLSFLYCKSTSTLRKEFMITRISSQNLFVDSLNIANIKRKNLTFSSGIESSSHWLDNTNFKESLIESLIISRLVNKISDEEKLLLNCDIIDLTIDSFYLVANVNVKNKIFYSFSYNNKVIKNFMIEADSFVKIEDEFFGGLRVQKAVELSIKNNIDSFLKELTNYEFNEKEKAIIKLRESKNYEIQ